MEKKKITVIRPATETLDIFLPFYFVTEHDTSSPVYHRVAEDNGLVTVTNLCPANQLYSWNNQFDSLPANYMPCTADDYYTNLCKITDHLTVEMERFAIKMGIEILKK